MHDSVNRRLQEVLAIHFDPQWGSVYWLERQRVLSLDVRKDIRTVDDLHLLGPMNEQALASRPVEDFIPRRFRDRRDYLIVETGGTMGRPKTAVHRLDEFHSAFVEPFLRAARRCGFPAGGHWLYVGPTGPHVIGLAAVACARATGSGDVFRVDFDPRWAKTLAPGSIAAQRYLQHIEQQAMNILSVQRIDVIFSTPAVLNGLADRLSADVKRNIRGIHFGGMVASEAFIRKMQREFPHTIALSGYGNTLFGMVPHLSYDSRTGLDYYPHGNRMIVQIVEQCNTLPGAGLSRTAMEGRRGRIVVHRLDEFQFIVNMVERDTAIRIAPLPDAAADGFILDGIRDPQPIVNQNVKPCLGLY